MTASPVPPFRSLATDPYIIAAGVAHTVLAGGLCLAPLAAVLGFERALATGLLATLTAPVIGARAAWRAREGGEPLGWWTVGTLLGAIFLLPSLIFGGLFEFLTLACDPRAGVELLLLIGGGNVLLGTALGFAVRALVARLQLPRPALLTTVGLLAVNLGWLGTALLRLYEEPQIYMFVQPFGWWPGSLYDEALTVTPALVGFRAVGALGSLALVFALRAVTGVGLRPKFSPSAGLMATAAACMAGIVSSHGESLGFDRDRQTVVDALSQTIETEHFILRAAPQLPRERVEALARDHELRWAQLEEFFGTAPEGKVTSFVYTNAAEKGRLIGAERTQIARPWVNEIHLNGAAFPHRVMKHELAHIFAGVLAEAPFNIPLISGLVPNIGLIEGIAVAADWPVRELTVHQWAAAMLRLKRLPSVARSLAPTGFWSLSSSRAYVAFGSFVGWLVQRRGIEAFGRIYSGESFESAYEETAEALESEWRVFLESVTLEPMALRLAEHRFSRPSIFEKVCARSAAELSKRAYARLASGDVRGAEAGLRQTWSLQPADPSPLLALARALARKGELGAARGVAGEALRAPGSTEASQLLARELLGEIDWREGRLEAAAEAFHTLREAGLSASSRRMQEVRLALIGEPLGELLLPYLAGEWPADQALVQLGELHRNHPQEALVAYLYARRLEAAELPQEGLTVALGLSLEELPAAVLRAEARLLTGRLALAAGRFSLAQDLFSAALGSAERPAVAAEATDWLERARFEMNGIRR